MSAISQVRVHAPGRVQIDSIAPPDPGPRDAVVCVKACGICGSDVGYVRLGGVAGPSKEPMPLGHELSGVVDAVGAEVECVAVGDRVVVDPLAAGNQIGNGGREGGFTPRLLVRNAADGGALVLIPDDLSFELAALAEPLGVGMQAVIRSGAKPGDRAVVFGAGPVGLMAVASLRDRGIDDVVSVDLSDTRLELARTLGASETIHPGREPLWDRLRELHGTAPVLGTPMLATDIYIEASGHSPLIGEVLANACSRATLSVVGLHRQVVPVSFLVVMMKELDIVGSMAQPDDWNLMVHMLNRIDLGPVITHRFELDQFERGLAIAQDPNAGGKVMIGC